VGNTGRAGRSGQRPRPPPPALPVRIGHYCPCVGELNSKQASKQALHCAVTCAPLCAVVFALWNYGHPALGPRPDVPADLLVVDHLLKEAWHLASTCPLSSACTGGLSTSWTAPSPIVYVPVLIVTAPGGREIYISSLVPHLNGNSSVSNHRLLHGPMRHSIAIAVRPHTTYTDHAPSPVDHALRTALGGACWRRHIGQNALRSRAARGQLDLWGGVTPERRAGRQRPGGP
jgi:hypothetical protein